MLGSVCVRGYRAYVQKESVSLSIVKALLFWSLVCLEVDVSDLLFYSTIKADRRRAVVATHHHDRCAKKPLYAYKYI